MKSMRTSIVFCAGAILLLASPWLSSLAEPVTPFAPGDIPSTTPYNASPTFAPDGKSVYFTQSPDLETYAIAVSQQSGSQWSAPQTAEFSGHFRDLEPAYAPSGKFLVFASNRPVRPGGPDLDGHYNSKTFPGKGGNLWKVERKKDGWSKPEVLNVSINLTDSVFSPSITADGSLYFMRSDDGGVFHIYRSQLSHGIYQTAERASFSNTTFGDYDPAVAPNESYLIFSSARTPATGKPDLFIVFRSSKGWSDPIDLRTALSDDVYGIEARLSPDGKTLYFTNSHNPSGPDDDKTHHIWQVSLTKVLSDHGIQ